MPPWLEKSGRYRLREKLTLKGEMRNRKKDWRNTKKRSEMERK